MQTRILATPTPHPQPPQTLAPTPLLASRLACLQVLDTLALNCSPGIRAQLAHKRFMQLVSALAGDRRQGPCSDAALQLLVDWAFMYKCVPCAMPCLVLVSTSCCFCTAL